MASGFPMNESQLKEAMEHDQARRIVEPIPLTRPVVKTDEEKLRELRRANFAAQALVGLIFHSGYNAPVAQTAAMAVQHADALLAELEKKR